MPDNIDCLLGDLTIASRPACLAIMRRRLRAVLKSNGCDAQLREDMVLAVNEACMNVIQHAYGNRPDGRIHLLILRYRKALVFRLQDQAPAVDVCTVRPRALDDIRPGGLGVHMMRELMDEVAFLQTPEPVGNLLQMTKYLIC